MLSAKEFWVIVITVIRNIIFFAWVIKLHLQKLDVFLFPVKNHPWFLKLFVISFYLQYFNNISCNFWPSVPDNKERWRHWLSLWVIPKFSFPMKQLEKYENFYMNDEIPRTLSFISFSVKLLSSQSHNYNNSSKLFKTEFNVSPLTVHLVGQNVQIFLRNCFFPL